MTWVKLSSAFSKANALIAKYRCGKAGHLTFGKKGVEDVWKGTADAEFMAESRRVLAVDYRVEAVVEQVQTRLKIELLG